MNQSGFEFPSQIHNSQTKRVSFSHAQAQKSSSSGKRKLEDNAIEVSQLASFTIRVRTLAEAQGEYGY
jgi:hypothetical protein